MEALSKDSNSPGLIAECLINPVALIRLCSASFSVDQPLSLTITDSSSLTRFPISDEVVWGPGAASVARTCCEYHPWPEGAGRNIPGFRQPEISSDNCAILSGVQNQFQLRAIAPQPKERSPRLVHFLPSLLSLHSSHLPFKCTCHWHPGGAWKGLALP